MKLATLRPQAKRDRQEEARYYHSRASPTIARELVAASRKQRAEDRHEISEILTDNLGELKPVPDLKVRNLLA